MCAGLSLRPIGYTPAVCDAKRRCSCTLRFMVLYKWCPFTLLADGVSRQSNEGISCVIYYYCIKLLGGLSQNDWVVTRDTCWKNLQVTGFEHFSVYNINSQPPTSSELQNEAIKKILLQMYDISVTLWCKQSSTNMFSKSNTRAKYKNKSLNRIKVPTRYQKQKIRWNITHEVTMTTFCLQNLPPPRWRYTMLRVCNVVNLRMLENCCVCAIIL